MGRSKRKRKAANKVCGPHCSQSDSKWVKKCAWDGCFECSSCESALSPRCNDWCEDHATKWQTKCNWVTCKKCNTCVKYMDHNLDGTVTRDEFTTGAKVSLVKKLT